MIKLKSISQIPKQPTYDLTIQDNHNYFVGDSCVLVHNSGKDPTKVDRSAAYAARYIAKNIVQAEWSDKAQIQISYAIGKAEPCSFRVKTSLTEHENRLIEQEVLKRIDLRPRAISERFGLRSPIYQETAKLGSYGHIPYEKNGYKFFPWEATDLFR